MSTRKYTYALHVQWYDGTWHPIAGCEGVPKQWAEGYVMAISESPGPTIGYRIVRSDGKLIHEQPAKTEVSIGMIAGWPSPEQYRSAAQRAIEKAEAIEKCRSSRENDP